MVQVVYLYDVYPTHGHARLDAIPVREPPGDRQWCHIEMPGGVPSVSSEHLGLLLVQESCHRGAPLKYAPC